MNLRDRIKDFRRVKASELRPNPRNWRIHPEAQQNALRGILAEIGIADALLARELPDGTLELVDGHLRTDVSPDTEWPVLVLDVTENEAAVLLRTLDPLVGMAEQDDAKLQKLLADIDGRSEAIEALLSGENDSDGDVELKQLDTKPPPKMSWVLIGIPTVRFGEIAEDIERLALLQDAVVETTVNDG